MSGYSHTHVTEIRKGRWQSNKEKDAGDPWERVYHGGPAGYGSIQLRGIGGGKKEEFRLAKGGRKAYFLWGGQFMVFSASATRPAV